MMPGVNYLIYGCSSVRTTPGVSLQLEVKHWRKILLQHSHKKRKDSLESSLDRVLLTAELEFPKILVPRLSQHTSNVNSECAGKSEWSKQQC